VKHAIDKWTFPAICALVLSTLIACTKKLEEPAPAASAMVAPPAVSISPLPMTTPPPLATAVAVDAGVAVAVPVLGDVKRFPDREKPATGAVKVTLDNSLVYDEPDDKTQSVASLTKGIFVERLATIGTDWILVDFPSGIGKLSPGWIEAKAVGATAQPTVTHATVAAQTKTATLATSGGATPAAAAPATVRVKPQLMTPPKH
jgi:hypothetical protein